MACVLLAQAQGLVATIRTLVPKRTFSFSICVCDMKFKIVTLLFLAVQFGASQEESCVDCESGGDDDHVAMLQLKKEQRQAQMATLG